MEKYLKPKTIKNKFTWWANEIYEYLSKCKYFLKYEYFLNNRQCEAITSIDLIYRNLNY